MMRLSLFYRPPNKRSFFIGKGDNPMIDTDEITKHLDALEQGRAQDMRLILARFDLLESDVETVGNQVRHVSESLKELDSRLSAHLSRLENKIHLIFEMLKTITNRLGE